jgi:hypothetical protein
MHIRFCALLRVLTLVAVGLAAFVFAGGASAVDPASAPSVQLMSPNGPGTWYVGDDCTAWADISDEDGLGYVEFWLSTDDGATFPILLGGVDGVNSIDCVVPDVETTTARVKVIASDALGNTATDVSDSAFTIAAREVVLAVDWLELSPTKVVGGSPAQATVTLSAPAPAGGAAVALASSNRSVAAVPATVTVPEGQTEATFTVSTSAVSATTSVRITASYGGYSTPATLTVAPAVVLPPRVAGLSLDPTVVVAGKAVKVTVTLTEPAPEGDAMVELSSSDPAVATVGESIVVVPAGETSAMSVVSSVLGSPLTTVTISASYGGATVSAPLTVTPLPATPIAILRADYAMSQGRLRVSARSSSATETLSVYVTSTGELIGTLKNVGGGDYHGRFKWPTNPVQITVVSAAGATDIARVRAR